MTVLRSEVFANPYFAGQVERYHTWPVHRRQSVGEHTWQVMMIWYQIFGPMSQEESEHILWHDAGELVTGDPPFPIKANNPALKAEYDRLECTAVEGMDGPPNEAREVTRLRAKVCDLLEMWEFGNVELKMGNKFAEPIVKDTSAAIGQLGGRLNRNDWDQVLSYLHSKRDWFAQL